MRPHTCVTQQEIEEKYASGTPEEFVEFWEELNNRHCPFCKRAMLLANLKKPAPQEGK